MGWGYFHVPGERGVPAGGAGEHPALLLDGADRYGGVEEYLSGKGAILEITEKKYQPSRPETTADNKLKRDFNAAAPNEKWATDVTEFKIPETGKKLYLSAIFDLYDRFPAAYAVSRRNDSKLVFDAYDKALRDNPDAKPVFPSDRGCHHTSRAFQIKLQKQGMEQSMSRVGHCIDHGPTEGLWGIIKSEMYCMHKITDESSLRSAIDNYMKFYAEERPQSGRREGRGFV